MIRYHDATRDDEFDHDVGVEILVETARMWQSLGHHDRAGGWHIAGVTGPDEYSAIADDNIYTNLMAERNLRAAVHAGAQLPRAGRGSRGHRGRGPGVAACRRQRRRPL